MAGRSKNEPASATGGTRERRSAPPVGSVVETPQRRGGRPARVIDSPLLHSALALVPPSVTATELEERFGDVGAGLEPRLGARLLEELADLGLVRATRRHGEEHRFVATSLGVRSLEAGIQGEAAIPLAELERLRTDLLSTIAHELRTPLTSVRTSVGLLLDPASEPTEAQQRALLDAIERNADRMQRLIGDILELSRFRSGTVTLQLRRFSASSLAEAAASVIAPLATRRRQRLELVPPRHADHDVYGDRRRLEQALLNLLANAHRFSPDGATITVRTVRRGDLTAWSVTDEGPGIGEADQARLFERFFVARGDRTSAREGVGLGLPIALAIAQAHGGTIEVESEVGVGSTFGLVVPTAGPSDEP